MLLHYASNPYFYCSIRIQCILQSDLSSLCIHADVVECLRNSSVNGQLTFELFVSGLQQSLKAAASKPGSPYQGGDAPPKPFKPVNLQQHGSETISSPLRTSQVSVLDSLVIRFIPGVLVC